MLKPDVRFESNVTVVTLGSEFEAIDYTAIDQFAEVLELASAVDPPKMVVNLGQTQYMDSAFLGLLFQIRSRLLARPGGRFGISNALPHCRDIFRVTRLDTLFELFDTCEEAVSEFASEFDGSSNLAMAHQYASSPHKSS